MTVLSLILAALLALPQKAVSFDVKDLDLRDFLMMMGESTNLNVILHPAVAGKVTLRVQNAPADVILDVVLKNYSLGYEINGNVMRIAPLSAIENEYRQRAQMEEARLNSKPLETRTYILSYAKAADMAPIFAQLLSPRGVVIVDARRNALIITDVAR